MKITLLMLSMVLFFSCNEKKKDYVPMGKAKGQHEVVVKEVINGGGYTYLLASEGSEELWVAVSKAEVAVGDKLFFKNSVEMRDFESKELGRVFERILFVDRISSQPIYDEDKKKNASAKANQKMQKLLDSISISPVKGGQTIEELYANSQKYATKRVAVRGQVVKVNMNIMDRNWVHLMDGTKGENRSDLTFTTKDIVKVGDTVVFEGVLAIDREFGAGYVYPLIVEDAELK